MNWVDALDVKIITPKTLTELLDIDGMLVISFAVEEQNEKEYVHLFCEHELQCGYIPSLRAGCDKCLRYFEERVTQGFVSE